MQYMFSEIIRTYKYATWNLNKFFDSFKYADVLNILLETSFVQYQIHKLTSKQQMTFMIIDLQNLIRHNVHLCMTAEFN